VVTVNVLLFVVAVLTVIVPLTVVEPPIVAAPPVPLIVRFVYVVGKIACAAPVYVTVLPVLVAVRVVMPEVPPRFSVALAACVNPPVPESAVATVNVLLLVKVTPVTVTLGIDIVPLNPCAFVLKV
jgi:hypothetical protein